jgi:protein-S-isoprenylcysteine O-methyltransferase Ste14
MLKLIIFAVASVGNVLFSWKPLKNPHSHGFYRFFAFELILASVLLKVHVWFNDPLSFHQIVSWVLLIICSALVVHGFYLLRAIGRPSGDFENTSRLVVVGAYKYIRHPMYASLFYLAWGVFFKDPDMSGLILVLLTTFFLVASARVEEGENIRKFGTEYTIYMVRTRMFIPFLY